jgi:predicted nuclease of predicted toxin-antitoxin system
MKIKLDQNLSQLLRDDLTALKHDVDTVVDQGLSGATDPEVLKAATSHDRILFTLDNDFLDLKKYPLDSHSGVVVFRPSRQGATAVGEFVKAFLRSTDLKKYYRRSTVVERRRARILKRR